MTETRRQRLKYAQVISQAPETPQGVQWNNGTMDLESQWKRICLELKVSRTGRAVRSKQAMGERKLSTHFVQGSQFLLRNYYVFLKI
jgi:hypothetical protein